MFCKSILVDAHNVIVQQERIQDPLQLRVVLDLIHRLLHFFKTLSDFREVCPQVVLDGLNLRQNTLDPTLRLLDRLLHSKHFKWQLERVVVADVLVPHCTDLLECQRRFRQHNLHYFVFEELQMVQNTQLSLSVDFIDIVGSLNSRLFGKVIFVYHV